MKVENPAYGSGQNPVLTFKTDLIFIKKLKDCYYYFKIDYRINGCNIYVIDIQNGLIFYNKQDMFYLKLKCNNIIPIKRYPEKNM
jgi:hypothetical protein